MKRALMLMLLVACGPVDLVVVDVPDAGEFVPMGTSCTRSSDCMAGQFCEKDSCGAPLGECKQRPAFCPGDGPPECGCDGVTYFNRCLRQNAGIESMRSEPGPCRNPRPCDATQPCPNGGFCARLVFPNECGLNAAGACWVLPEVACQGPRPTFVPCAGAPTCLDVCEAAKREQPMAERPRNAGPCP